MTEVGGYHKSQPYWDVVSGGRAIRYECARCDFKLIVPAPFNLCTEEKEILADHKYVHERKADRISEGTESRTANIPEPCDHHWVAQHDPGHILYWVKICSICHEPDWDDLDHEILKYIATGLQPGKYPPGPTYIRIGGKLSCEDCGVHVQSVEAHNRFHSILSGHAWTLAILETSHASGNIHERYDVIERIGRRKFDSWSSDALAEVVQNLEEKEKQVADAETPIRRFASPDGNSVYLDRAREIVTEYFNSRRDITDDFELTFGDTFVVWFCKTLQNWKAMVSTNVPDGMYYEITYDGDKHQAYVDAYRKQENITVQDGS